MSPNLCAVFNRRRPGGCAQAFARCSGRSLPSKSLVFGRTMEVADDLSVDGAWRGLRARPNSCTLSGVYVHSRGVSVHSWRCSYTPMGVQRMVLHLSAFSAPVDTTANVWNLSQSFVGLLLRSFSDLHGALLSACRRRQHPTGVRRRHCWPPVSDEPPIGRRCAACYAIGRRAEGAVSYAPPQLAACLR